MPSELRRGPRELLEAIIDWKGEGPPTLPKLAARLELADASSVRVRMLPLIDAGFIVRDDMGPGLPKVPRVTPEGYEALGRDLPDDPQVPGAQVIDGAAHVGLVSIPASCGPVRFLDSAVAEPIDRLRDLFESYVEGDYIVIAEGDSMSAPGDADSIPSGARVQCRRDVAPVPDDEVHFGIDRGFGEHESGLAIFELGEAWDTDTDGYIPVIVLRKRNPTYQPLTLRPEQVTIYGIVISVLSSRRGRRRSVG